MNNEKKKIYLKKINDYKIDYNLTGNIKLLEKMEKYKKKLNNEGGGRHSNKTLTPEQITDLIEKIRNIFERNIVSVDECKIFGNYLALSIKINIIEDGDKLKNLGELVKYIILKILDETTGKKKLEGDKHEFAKMSRDELLKKLITLLNNDVLPDSVEQGNFFNDIETEIKNILFNIDFDGNQAKVNEVIIPALGIELGSLFARRMPVRLLDPCILIGSSVLPEMTPLEIQRQFGILIMEESGFLNSIVSDEIAESLPPQRICGFGFRLFRFFTQIFEPHFKLELKDNMLDIAFGSFGTQAIEFLRCLSPQVEVLLQIPKIGRQFYDIIKEIFTSLNSFKKAATLAVIPALPSRKLEAFNVNDDVAKTPLLVSSRLIQRLDTNPELEGSIPQTFVFLDSSGSQKGDTNIRGETHERNYDDEINPVLIFVRTLLEKQDVFFHKFGGIPVDTPPGYAVCDRGNRVPVAENGWKKISRDGLTSESLFSHSVTDTVMVKNGLESLPQNFPINLVFQCDGNFTMGSTPLDSILTRCVDKLQNIKRVTLLFSPWTIPRDQENLTRAIRLVVNSIASSIVFESILLPRPTISVGNPPMQRLEPLYVSVMTQPQKSNWVAVYAKQSLEIYDNGRKKPCVLLPPEFYSFKDFMVHRDLTPLSIVKLLTHLPEVRKDFIDQMINLLIETIVTNPELLNIDGNIYQMLHSVARLLQSETFVPGLVSAPLVRGFVEADGTFKISKAYINWISDRTVRSPSVELSRLIAESKISKQEIKYTEFILSKSCIGNFFFKNSREVTSINIDRIRSAVTRPESSDIFNLFDTLIPELLFVPKKEVPLVFPPRTFGLPVSIVCPDVEKRDPMDVEKRDPMLAITCLSSFFVPFGSGTLNIFTCTQLAMYAFSSDRVSGNANFMRICISFCLNLLENNDFFKQVIGYDIKRPTDFSNIDDKWFIYENTRLLYRFLLLIPTESKQKYSNLTEYFAKICRLISFHSLCNRNLSGQNKVLITHQRIGPRGETELRPGSIVHLNDSTWNHGDCVDINQSDCPWKSLPAIVRILERKPERDRHAMWWCEYYDHALGTHDTHSIRQGNLTDILCFNKPPRDIDVALQSYLISERHKDGEANTARVGEGGVPRNVDLHAQRLQVVRDICKRWENVGEREVRSEVTIPKEKLLELVGFPLKVKALLASNLSKATILDAIKDEEVNQVVLTASVLRPPVMNRITFEANSRTYELNEAEITAFLQRFHSRLTPFEEWSGSQLKIETCSMCQEIISSVGQVTTVKLVCNHVVCGDCFESLIPNYNQGDFLVPYLHRCALCNTFISPSLYPKMAAKWWAPLVEQMERQQQCISSSQDAEGHPTKWRFCGNRGGCHAYPLFNAKNGGGCDIPDESLPFLCKTHNVDTEIRPCPECGMPIERSGGCDKLTCCPYGTDRCGPLCNHERRHNGNVIARCCGTIFCFWCLQVFGVRQNGQNPLNSRRAYDHIWGRDGWQQCPLAVEARRLLARPGGATAEELQALQRQPHQPPNPVSTAQAAQLGIPPSFPQGTPPPQGGAAAGPRGTDV